MVSTRTQRARVLRSTPNTPEQALWSALKGRQLGGFKFTRQFPLGPYIADFVCREKCLVIELDGSQHHDNADHDRNRDLYMLQNGYSVLRVPSATALNNLVGLCETILAALDDRMEGEIDAPDLRFRRSGATPVHRGDASRSALKRIRKD